MGNNQSSTINKMLIILSLDTYLWPSIMPDCPTIVQSSNNRLDDEAISSNGAATSPIDPSLAVDPASPNDIASPTDSIIICEAYL